MKNLPLPMILSMLFIFGSCSDDKEQGPELATGLTIRVTSSITQQYSGNIESVRVVEGRSLPSAIAVASKSKTIRYLENDGSTLRAYLEDFNMAIPGSEDSELTNSAVYDEDHVFVTLTELTKNSDGKITECSDGVLLLVTNKENSIGYKSATIGPMPDAVAISPDKKYIITADEYDAVPYGKCPNGAENQGISIFDLDAILDHGEYKNTLDNLSLGDLKYSKQIKFTNNALGEPREPEYIAFASDSNTVAVTLQDSYEVALFKMSDIMSKAETTLDESVVQFVDIPANSA